MLAQNKISAHNMSMKHQLSFTEKVYAATRLIRFGHVVTYQDIAKKIGHPQASRAVGNALHRNPTNIETPCHRVVNREGRLAQNFGFDGPIGQQELLEKEGVVVLGFRVDLRQYQDEAFIHGRI